MKSLLKVITAAIFCLLCAVGMIGCTENETVDVVCGFWSTREISINDNFKIDEICLSIEECEYETASANIISLNEKNYAVQLKIIINGQPEIFNDNLGVTYYSKVMRIAFSHKEDNIYMTCAFKKCNESIFISATILLNDVSTNITLST
ncbi:MAG: hypothetical protein K2O89_00175 [Clostridia bacterium]|nr:hypothetical protein [Clostridia bacterium]